RRTMNNETNNGNNRQDESIDDVFRDDAEKINTRFRERINKFIAAAQEKKPPTNDHLKKDRTRSLTLLIGGTGGAVLLFLGIFSAPPAPLDRENRGHAAPNLGRPRSSESNNPALPKSVTPLLNADVRSDDLKGGDISPADIQNTSRSPVESDGEN